jgi:hypothetical protein
MAFRQLAPADSFELVEGHVVREWELHTWDAVEGGYRVNTSYPHRPLSALFFPLFTHTLHPLPFQVADNDNEDDLLGGSEGDPDSRKDTRGRSHKKRRHDLDSDPDEDPDPEHPDPDDATDEKPAKRNRYATTPSPSSLPTSVHATLLPSHPPRDFILSAITP